MRLCKVDLSDGIYKALWFLYDLTINEKTYKTQQGEFMMGQAFEVKVENGYAYRIL